MEALLLIDLQKDFADDGSLPVSGTYEMLPYINGLMKRFRSENKIIIATQDWHPKKSISFFTSHKDKNPFEEVKIDNYTQLLWPVHCVRNTAGAKIIKDINQKYIDKIIRKGTDVNVDSNSAFFDNQNLHQTPLQDYLQKYKISSLYIVGVAFDVCVYYTILDALKHGYKVTVDMNGCRAVDSKKVPKILNELMAKKVIIIK